MRSIGTGRWRPGNRVVLLAAAAAAFALLIFVAVVREGPNGAVVGVVSELELHRICVNKADDERVCAHVDSPSAIDDIDLGDCIRLQRSPEETFESAKSSDDCS